MVASKLLRLRQIILQTTSLLLSVAVFALAACGSDDKADTDKADKNDAIPAGEVVEVTINATNFEFDVKEIKANVGDTIKLTVINDAGVHGVGFDEFDVDVAGGDTVEFQVTEAGEFDYYCSVLCGVGHDKMSGTLIVS